MKLAWLTDIHLNFLDQDTRFLFYQNIVKTHCDALLISGDIAEATSIVDLLKEMAKQINKPISSLTLPSLASCFRMTADFDKLST